MSKLSERLRVRANFHARRAPAAARDMKESADALDAMEAALRDLADTIPTDARAYAIGPVAAAAHKQAREVLAKLEGGA
jgi:hypothetical protein